jgi:hypothetical protein
MRDCGRNRVAWRVRVQSRSRVKVRKYATKVQLLLPKLTGCGTRGETESGPRRGGRADAGETECVYTRVTSWVKVRTRVRDKRLTTETNGQSFPAGEPVSAKSAAVRNGLGKALGGRKGPSDIHGRNLRLSSRIPPPLSYRAPDKGGRPTEPRPLMGSWEGQEEKT